MNDMLSPLKMEANCRSDSATAINSQFDFELAYNVASFLRRMALAGEIDHWSLTTLRENLVKTGAKVVRHAKYLTFQLAEVAVPRQLFGAILDRIARLAMLPPEVATSCV